MDFVSCCSVCHVFLLGFAGFCYAVLWFPSVVLVVDMFFVVFQQILLVVATVCSCWLSLGFASLCYVSVVFSLGLIVVAAFCFLFAADVASCCYVR